MMLLIHLASQLGADHSYIWSDIIAAAAYGFLTMEIVIDFQLSQLHQAGVSEPERRPQVGYCIQFKHAETPGGAVCSTALLEPEAIQGQRCNALTRGSAAPYR